MASRYSGGAWSRADHLVAVDQRAKAGLGHVPVFRSLSGFFTHSLARLVLAWSADCRYPAMGRDFCFASEAVVGIVFSLPLGVLLALGRRSLLPTVRLVSIVFIEFVRGVPFITILFMANNLLSLFLPETWSLDRLLRPLVEIIIFSAAYMAEEARGGLQSLGKGQREAAMALGPNYVRMTVLVILPQALTLVIPGIVNNFIGLFMDTTLISVVGATDFLEAMNNAIKDPVWPGPTIMVTGYVFAGAFYFSFCFGMAQYSVDIERVIAKGRK
jgi:general L-amino acid transport system permease protein